MVILTDDSRPRERGRPRHTANGRDYTISAQFLKSPGLQGIRLMTNNPRKLHVLKADGLKTVERVPLQEEPNAANRRYLETTRDTQLTR